MKLDPKKTALLTLDFQKGVFGLMPGAETVIPAAARAVEFARKQQYLLIHVGIGFAEGHPEISDVESVFKMLKQKNLFVIGTPSAEFHSAIASLGQESGKSAAVTSYWFWVLAGRPWAGSGMGSL